MQEKLISAALTAALDAVAMMETQEILSHEGSPAYLKAPLLLMMRRAAGNA